MSAESSTQRLDRGLAPAAPSAGLGRPLAGILVVALSVRLAIFAWLRDVAPYSDFFYYHEAGRLSALDWGLWFDRERLLQLAKLNWWPPLYPMFLGMVYEVTGAAPRAVALLQVVLGAASCVLVGLLAARAVRGKDAHGTSVRARRAGIVAAALVAVDPTWVFLGNVLASENLFVPLLLAGLWLADAGRTRLTPRRALCAGVVLGLACLTRAAGLVVLAVVIAWRLHRTLRDARGAALLAAGAIAVLLPWSVRNAVVLGRPALVAFGGGLNFYYGHNPESIGYRPVSRTPFAGLQDPVEIDGRAWRLAWRDITAHPGRTLADGFRKIGALFGSPRYALQANNAVADSQTPGAVRLLGPDHARARLLHRVFGPLATVHAHLLLAAGLAGIALSLGMGRAIRRRPATRAGRNSADRNDSRGSGAPPEIVFYGLLVLAYVALHVVFWAQPRFRHPLDAFLAILAAWVAARPWRRESPP